MQINKKTTIIIGMVCIVLLATSIVSAEFWACFSQGEKVDYCGGYKPSKTCSSTNGCQWCMSEYREIENCYIHGSWPQCTILPQICSLINGNNSIDSEPPVLELISPLNEELYTKRKILLEFNLDERADVYYYDLIEDRGRWIKVCNDCYPGSPSYSRERSFNEGENRLQFKAVDVVGNTVYENITFYIDSQKPRISKTEPRGGYASGEFSVEFKEENPEKLTLYYGIDYSILNIEEDCEEDRRGYSCNIEVDLSSYDEQDIEYYFVLEDKAGNVDESRHNLIEVDYSAPVIHSAEWIENGKNRELVVNVTEKNLDKIEYIDWNDDRARWSRLCSRLDDDGLCYGRVRFNDGEHDVEIRAIDKAGNEARYNLLNFFTDSRDPRLLRTEPRRGFADGNFEVQFIEENPEKLTLYYGEDYLIVNIEEECYEDRRGYYCNTYAELDKYHGQKIEYYFVLEDRVGNVDESRPIEVEVDTVTPELVNSEDFWGQGGGRYNGYIYFDMEIIEENFDEAFYTYEERGRMRDRRICSRLYEGMCEGIGRFREGSYNITVSITDKAGNSIGYPISFEVVNE